MRLEIDDREFQVRTEHIQEGVLKSLEIAMNDAVDDLVRISSAIAPIDTGVLRRSWQRDVKVTEEGIVGEVSYSAIAKSKKYGAFNYAIWTHEATYNLGPRSAASPGTDGYAVGNKYLARPLYGESKKYMEWFREAVEKGVNG